MEITYLCIPYSFNPEESFRIANEVSAEMMMNGICVISPISHSHPISFYMPEEKRLNQEFWMGIDLPILERCDSITLVVIGEQGWELLRASKGCTREIMLAMEKGKQIKYYYYE